MVNWNTRDMTRASLQSIYDCTKTRSFEVIVVDNGSTDGSADMVEREFPQAILHRSEKNIGFADGCNLGAKMSRGRYILMINTDTVVYDSAIDIMLKYMDEHPDVGVVGAKLLWGDGTVQRESVGNFPTLQTAFNLFFMLSALFPKKKQFRGMFSAAPDTESEVEWISSAVMFFRREAFEQIGGFPVQYRAFMEDVHSCLLLHQHNWKVIYLPSAEIVHYTRGSTKLYLRAVKFNAWKSISIYFYGQHGLWRTVVLQFMALFGFTLRAVAYGAWMLVSRNMGLKNRFRQNFNNAIFTLSLLYEMATGKNWRATFLLSN